MNKEAKPEVVKKNLRAQVRYVRVSEGVNQVAQPKNIKKGERKMNNVSLLGYD